MQAHLRWLLLPLLILSLLASSCSRPAQPPRSPKAKSLPKAVAAAPDEEERAPAPSTDKPTAAADATNSAGPVDDEAHATERSPIDEPKTFATERLLLLTPLGPLVVDLAMSIDGRPFDAQMQQVIDEIMQLSDIDGDGRTTWEELTTNRLFRYGQYGTMSLDNEESRRQLIRQYDVDRDETLDRDEVPRMLAMNNASSGAFRLDSTPPADFEQSSLADLLDEDRNRALTADEIERAALRVIARDTDDDHVVRTGDLAPARGMVAPMMAARTYSSRRSSAWLNSYTSWNTIYYMLGEQYGLGPQPDKNVPLLTDLYQRLDLDEDGDFSNEELEELTTITPHLIVRARFGKPDDAATRALEVEHIAEVLAPHVEVSVDTTTSVLLRLGAVPFRLSLAPGPDRANFQKQAESIFPQLDLDANGYLTQEEVATIGVTQLEAVDADANEQVSREELAGYYRQQQAFALAQVRAQAGGQGDPLFAAIDPDLDGRLTEREISSLAEALQALDSDGDNRITPREIPTSLMLQLSRGSAAMPAAQQTTYAENYASPQRENVPRWFSAMDANNDGEISGREFLGNADQFQQLDTDQDGFIGWPEIEPESAATAPEPVLNSTGSDSPDSAL